MPEAQWGSRHLGLLTAEEVQDLSVRISLMGEQFEKTVDVERLLSVAEEEQTVSQFCSDDREISPWKESSDRSVRIAAARDSAFSFYYEDSFDALRRAGAELVWFSPLKDQAIPEHCGGLYLGGGYPELYMKDLNANESMTASIRNGRGSVKAS